MIQNAAREALHHDQKHMEILEQCQVGKGDFLRTGLGAWKFRVSKVREATEKQERQVDMADVDIQIEAAKAWILTMPAALATSDAVDPEENFWVGADVRVMWLRLFQWKAQIMLKTYASHTDSRYQPKLFQEESWLSLTQCPQESAEAKGRLQLCILQ